MEIQKERHATHLLHAHLVFVTKYRYKVLQGKHIVGGAPLEIVKQYIEQQKTPD